MTAAEFESPRRPRFLRLVVPIRDVVAGTLLCLTPVSAVLVLGWLVRRMQSTIARRRGLSAETPGWILGRRGTGFFGFWLGGAAENIRVGLMAGIGLYLLTLPFTLAWFGAWWAGWENSFNKGYEQAAVGPLVWGLATFISLPVLVHLPIALGHMAANGRFAALFEWQQIRSLAARAGPRLVWLAMLSVLACLPFFALRALPVFVEGLVPGFADMTLAEQGEVARWFTVAGAALAFMSAAFLKHRAAVIYAHALARPARPFGVLWVLLASAIWAILPALIVIGQFLNYSPVYWISHPLLHIPWFG